MLYVINFLVTGKEWWSLHLHGPCNQVSMTINMFFGVNNTQKCTEISLKDVPLLHRQSYLWVMLEEIRLSCKQYLDQLMSQLGAAAVVDDFHHQDTRSIEVLHKVIEKSSECITLPNNSVSWTNLFASI